MFQTIQVAARDRERLREIGGIVSRHGLGLIAARLGLGRDGDGDAEDAATTPARARAALEALGPTFVKLGQILATRSDLLDPQWIAELEQLQSGAPTLPFEALRGAVEAALGAPVEAVFATFDTVPLAAASMAQVHRATLMDGRAVVLKIRRPDIRPKIEGDLRLLAELAAIAERRSAEARRFRVGAMVRQLTDAILEELDFTVEGRNADRIREDFAGDARVVVPEVHWASTSETLLVMDFVEGVEPRGGDDLRAAGIDPAVIASVGADMVLDMVLVNGRFHGDPHPGNLRCLPGNRIALLDLGLVGHVSPRRREEFIGFTQALLGSDADALADVLLRWSGGPREPARDASEKLVARHGGRPLVLDALVADFMASMRDHALVMPADLILIFKALVTIDGVLTRIEPGFDLSAALRRAGERIALARLSPAHWQPILRDLAFELARLGDKAPRLVRAAARRLESDDAVTRQPPAEADPARRRALDRIFWAILAGSAMVALAILAQGRF